jgi:hypothetical protein
MQQLVSASNNLKISPPKQVPEYLECWVVATGAFFIGPKIPHHIQHKRGQAQLRKMVEIYQEMSLIDRKGLDVKDGRVKTLLKWRHDQDRKKNKGGRWVFVAARLLVRDVGSTGLVTTEKAMVIIKRKRG